MAPDFKKHIIIRGGSAASPGEAVTSPKMASRLTQKPVVRPCHHPPLPTAATGDCGGEWVPRAAGRACWRVSALLEVIEGDATYVLRDAVERHHVVQLKASMSLQYKISDHVHISPECIQLTACQSNDCKFMDHILDVPLY